MRDITGFHLTPLTLIYDESKVRYGLKYWSKRAEKSQIYTLRILEALFVVYEKLVKVDYVQPPWILIMVKQN